MRNRPTANRLIRKAPRQARAVLTAPPMRRASEKRRHPRYDGSGLWARLKIDGAITPAELENVSLGGALVAMNRLCPPGKNVMLELRGSQKDLRVVGRVVGFLPKGKGRRTPAARVCFNASSQRHTEQLYALIRGLPADCQTFSSCMTDPEAFEFHEIKLQLDDTFDIDVDEPEYELSQVADERTAA